jgi:hypothetical protein
MTRKITTLAIAVLALGSIAAGCGGDDDETSTVAPATTTETTGTTGATGATDIPPERAELIEEADAICAEGDEEIDAEGQKLFGDSNTEPSAAEQEAFVEDTVVPSIQEQLDGLSELEPPEADAEEFQSIIDNAQSALDELEQNPGVLGSGEDDPFADVNEQAQEFGLTKCGGD